MMAVTQLVLTWQVSEISFINTLEAQNRKIEVQERYQVKKFVFRHFSVSLGYLYYRDGRLVSRSY